MDKIQINNKTAANHDTTYAIYNKGKLPETGPSRPRGRQTRAERRDKSIFQIKLWTSLFTKRKKLPRRDSNPGLSGESHM